MRTLLNISAFVLAVLVLHSTAASPQATVQSENKFLYNEALRATLEVMNRDFGKLNLTEHGSRAPIDFHNMIVHKDPAITDGLSSTFAEYRVTYLDDASLISRRKKLQKEFAILVSQPLDCPEGRLRITVQLSWINYRRGQLQFGIDSWANVYFRYDAATRTYVVDNVELAGV